MKLNNLSQLKERRKQLRNNSTTEENILWSKLKNRKIFNFKFRRQHSIAYYILDFYCPEKKLCIELDGNQHNQKDNLDYDKNRTEFLNAVGIEVLRFNNYQINTNIDEVVNMISEKLKEEPPQQTNPPPY